jgi:hypothetical protein
MKNSYFYDMIKTLLSKEEVMLYENILSISEEEKAQVSLFLQEKFIEESTNYPFSVPDFNTKAALWAAEYVYLAAQLIVYRKDNEIQLEALLPKSNFEITPSTLLSVDLCFRFIPDMIRELQIIDSEDPLLLLLETELCNWHYSGINYITKLDSINLAPLFTNQCLQQLYLNRVVEYKNTQLAQHPEINLLLMNNFGIYEKEYWNTFKSIVTHE